MTVWPCGGMTEERYYELFNNIELELTTEEWESGWYWSDAFDGLLVHKSWPEAEYD
ncbi:hypothetical protein D3C87_1339250 [compost metagenome]